MPTPREMMEAAQRREREEQAMRSGRHQASQTPQASSLRTTEDMPDASATSVTSTARGRIRVADEPRYWQTQAQPAADTSRQQTRRQSQTDHSRQRERSRETAPSNRSQRSRAREQQSTSARPGQTQRQRTQARERVQERERQRQERTSQPQRQRDEQTSRSSRAQAPAQHSAAARASESREPRARAAHAAAAPTAPQAQAQPRNARSRHLRERITQWRMFGVTAFGAIMVIGGLIGLLFFARPATSAVEMRTLTAFPEFTAESFLDGSYFTQVSLWYADTYPLREPMVAADHAIDSLFGINTGTGMVGGNVQADEIPVAEDQEETVKPVVVAPPAAAPDEHAVAADIQENIMSGIYVNNGSGYAIYYFSQNAADTYIAAMNTAAEQLDGVSTVYSIMAPANSITLSDEQAASVGGSDQQQTLDYLRTRFDDRVKTVELVDTIKQHRDEYLYFHTDHHWTQLGAYYAYVEFCNAKGITPKGLDSWREVNLGDFQGTYYDTIEAMGDVAADTITAYVPSGTNEMTYSTSYGEEITGPVINEEAASWDPSLKYSAFIAGDQPLEVIHNPAITDGSSCLVVKDSYGCAFVPELVDSYETVHVIDFRETDKNLCDYARDNNIKDVIFLTGMKIGLTDSVAQTLLAEVSPSTAKNVVAGTISEVRQKAHAVNA